ncbi:MAG: hypothetical protein DME76_11910 [Verrucomicrobia bacterium]|nr:MAG: hypothetical protein DME76_11910 [Verrucomicrobiota bacterium]
MFSARNPVDRERLPGEITIVSIELAGTKVCAIKKDLKTGSCFHIRPIRSGLASWLFSRCRWKSAAQYQDGHDCKT